VRKKYFVLGWPKHLRQYKNLLYRHDEPNEPTKARPPLFVVNKSPFASASTVSGGHPSERATETNLHHLKLCPPVILFRNVWKFADAYKKRTEILSQLNDKLK
jgi:hypothetical protein